MKPALEKTLSLAGFEVDAEDKAIFLQSGAQVWRDKKTNQIEPTKQRRRIDLVVRLDGKVVALIETESDLNDLRERGVSSRNGHYDVYSIARNGAGEWFNSYKSLERMAAAAFYASGGTTSELESIQSDLPSDHNPLDLPFFLVTGLCRPIDRHILEPRRSSLGATIVSVIDR